MIQAKSRQRLFLLVAWAIGAANAGLAQSATSKPSVPVADAVATARQWLAKADRSERVETPYRAIEIEHRRYSTPRPLSLWIVKIDVAGDGVEPVLTRPDPSKGDDGKAYETRSRTTLDFARESGVQLAINTSAFAPLRGKPGEPMDLNGLAAVDGKVFSKPNRKYGAIFIDQKGHYSLKAAAGEAKSVWTVIPGFRMLVDDRKVVVAQAESDSAFGGLQPRTSIGVDEAGTTLWLVVADGRQPGFSMGMSLAELAAFFRGLDVWDALNLDGGGSSTLVLQDADGTHRVLNSTISGGKPGGLRQVGNNLGFRLPKRDAAAANGPARRPGARRGEKP